MPRFSCSIAGHEIPSGRSASDTKSSSASVTPRQADNTTASRGLSRRLDDIGDAPETIGIGDARTAKFMYDPLIHIHTRPAVRVAFCALPNVN
jgi:hypothetical protein